MEKNIQTIWQHFSDDLRRFILTKVNDADIAEDILQESFIKMHAHLDSLRDDTRIQAWIYQIVRHAIVDYYRARSRESHKLENLPGTEEGAGDDSMSEAVQDMIKMMDSLPPEYCEALCLTELGGLSQKEYAMQIGISYSGAKSRVQRARQMLRDMLMRCCHYQFDRYGTVIGIDPVNCCCCSEN